MRCKTAERWILRSLDGRLDAAAEAELRTHCDACPSCARARREYRVLLSRLRGRPAAEPLPAFWERLEPRLEKEARLVPWLTWERWSLRAIPVCLALAVAMGGLFLTAPAETAALTPTEVMLYENGNPIPEAQALFEQTRVEDRGLMLIFASDVRSPGRQKP